MHTPPEKQPPKAVRIQDLNEADRPREKMAAQGVRALTDAELLAILIRTGTSTHNALEVAHLLLKEEEYDLFKVYTRLRRGTAVTNVPGLGAVKSATLLAAMELGIRTYLQKEQNDEHRTSLLRSDLLYYYMKDMLVLETEEQVWAVMLDVKGNFIARHLVARGGFTSAAVDIRVILQRALRESATAIALIHNHPSGDATPSTQDDDLTARLKEACRTLDILLVDHIIYVDNQNNYYSYYDNNRIL